MTVADIITGVVHVPIRAHLTDDSPLVFPLDLATIREASFRGYLPAPCSMSGQAPSIGGLGFGTARFTFVNTSGNLFIRPTALYLTAEGSPRILIYVQYLALSILDPVSVGSLEYQLQLESFLRP